MPQAAAKTQNPITTYRIRVALSGLPLQEPDSRKLSDPLPTLFRRRMSAAALMAKERYVLEAGEKRSVILWPSVRAHHRTREPEARRSTALAIPSSARGIDMERARAPLPQRPGRAILRGLLDLRPSVRTERTAVAVEEAVFRGLAVAKVYAFASADYPGAAQSLLFDNDGTTAVGAFVVDPSSGTTPTTATQISQSRR